MTSKSMNSPIASSGIETLYRAIVAVPDPRGSRPYAERIVFFESRPGEHPCAHLERLLAMVWGVETSHWCEDGGIYNVHSASDLERNCLDGVADIDGLFLVETGAGGEYGIGPQRIHYARAADVDCFVSPLLAMRLQRVLWVVEALYSDQDATNVLARLRATPSQRE